MAFPRLKQLTAPATGRSFPIGATLINGGTNFSIFSRTAASIELLLFDNVDDARPSCVIPIDPLANRTYHYWHVFVPGVKAGQVYGFRAFGPFQPDRGLRFDPSKLLLDPYARAIVVPKNYSREAARREGDNLATAMKSVVTDPHAYDWEGDVPLKRPWSRSIIYEMHVRGFTAHPSSGLPESKRGTYAALVDKIPYLRQLGVTAVELLPVFQFDPQDAPRGRRNYWGYSPVAFFAPHQAYSSRQERLGAVDEFRDMVKALHRAGIEVILDVVFNHTAEGGQDGPTQCFRGLDNPTYYLLGADQSLYRVSGIHSYYASDDDRNRTKLVLEALIRSLPERSMRLQVRFEIAEGADDLIARYNREQQNPSAVLQAVDREQSDLWLKKNAEGYYLQQLLHFYFIWDPRIHHQSPEVEWKKKMRSSSFSMSANKCIERSRREHEDLVAEFNSLMSGVEASLQATGMKIERLTQNDIFLEVKRALNPLVNDKRPFLPPRESLVYESARSQMASVNIEDELDEHVKIGGLLYSFISLKDLPDATFPGVLRELVVMDFPIIINAEVVLPDQTKAVKQYKSRLRKMTAAQKDIHGGFRLNVDAQVAEHQLIKVLQELISSSLKSCQLSLTIAVRTSRAARNRFEAEEAERTLADRRQRVLHAIGRMNGARGIPETLAQKRFFFSSLPGLGEINKREKDVLTLHAADLLPVEMPWKGTPNSPLMLFETPYRQLIPFSPFDSGLGDANMLIMAKSGGGKTFLAQLKLLMMARARPLVSILERGDSYEPLVDLMGGRVINVDLDGRETLNPWDLPEGETGPSNEKTAFLKNLTRHMLGDSHNSDTSLLDNVLTDAITQSCNR